MSTTLAVFINEDLDYVKKECDELISLFGDERLELITLLNPDVDKVINTLQSTKNKLTGFHFSGHSDNEGLELYMSTFAHGKGLMPYLNNFPSLKFVFINGCCNSEMIYQLNQIPVVIGTQTDIGDQTATEFAINIYQHLIQKKGEIQESFDDAKNIMATIEDNSVALDIIERPRGVVPTQQVDFPDIDYNCWLLLHLKEETSYLTMTYDHLIKQTRFAYNIEQAFKSIQPEGFDMQFRLPFYFPANFTERFKKFFIKSFDEDEKDCSKIGIDRFLEMRQLYGQFMLFIRSITFGIIRKNYNFKEKDGILDLLNILILYKHGDTDKLEIVQASVELIKELNERLCNQLPEGKSRQLCKDISKIDEDLLIALCETFNNQSPGRDEFYMADRLFEEFIKQAFFLTKYNIESIRTIQFSNYPHFPKPDYCISKIEFVLDPLLQHKYFNGSQKKFSLNSPGNYHLASVFLVDQHGDYRLNLTPFMIDLNSLVRASIDFPHADFYYMNFYRQEDSIFSYIKNSSLSSNIDNIGGKELSPESIEIIQAMIIHYIEKVDEPSDMVSD